MDAECMLAMHGSGELQIYGETQIRLPHKCAKKIEFLSAQIFCTDRLMKLQGSSSNQRVRHIFDAKMGVGCMHMANANQTLYRVSTRV